MGEEKALPAVQSLDGGHVLRRQAEIEDLKVLAHPLLMDGLRDDNDIALDQEAQGGLGGGLSVLFPDGGEDGVREHILPSLGEGAPGLRLAAVLPEILPGHLLLLEDVGLDLVDGGLHLREVLEVQVAVRPEVGDADGPELSLVIELLHGPVGAVVVSEGLVDEEQVQVIRPEPAQGRLNGRPGLLIARVGDPDLGGEEELLPGQAALRQGLAHALLVVVGLGGVDGPVAHVDGLPHAAAGILRRRLIDPVAQLRHLDAVM